MADVRGIYWEDIVEGSEVTTPARTMTETDIVNFCGVSGDFNVIHTDAELAKSTPFGGRIAHGLLGLSMGSGLLARLPQAEHSMLVAFLGLTWDFRNPIMIGDTIRVVQRVTSKRRISKPGLGLVHYDTKIINQRGQVCQEGEFKILYQCRNAE